MVPDFKNIRFKSRKEPQKPMDLRHFLFEHRLSQQRLIKAIINSGNMFYHPQMSKLVQGKERMGAIQRQKIRKGLLKLGFSLAQIDGIDELSPAHQGLL